MTDPDIRPDFLETSPDDQRDAIAALWQMMTRHSAYPQVNRDAQFRWLQLRFKGAVVARMAGVLDATNFDAESTRYVGVMAGAMGCTTVTTIELPAPGKIH